MVDIIDLPLLGFGATFSPPGGGVPVLPLTSFDLRFMGLREGAVGREGRDVLEGWGPGVISSRMWANILSNLQKTRITDAFHISCFNVNKTLPKITCGTSGG